MKSEIYLSERVDNTDRKFGSLTYYFPVKIVDFNGKIIPALFSRPELDIAIKRAESNPEDWLAIDNN